MSKHFLKSIFILLLFSVTTFTVIAQADELMIVEYVDWSSGSGFGIKLFNPTNTAINLSSYTLEVYNNGNTSPNGNYSLSGTINPLGTLITGNTPFCGTDCNGTCNLTNSSSGVNGNDVVVIRKNGNIVDMVGLLGYDPGNSGWKVNNTTNALKWNTITRNSTNCTRYTSTTGSGANSWPNSSSTNVTGWSVSSVSCLSQGFTLNISSTTPKILIPSKDTVVCKGTSINFTADGSYIWKRRNGGGETVLNNSATSLSITFNQAGQDTILVQAENCGVVTSDTVIVTVGAPFTFSLGADTSICGNINHTLQPTVNGATYLWQDNSIQNSYTATTTGWFWAKATRDNCTYTDSINISTKTANTFNLGADTSLCQGDSLVLTYSCVGCSYLWNTAATANSITIKQNGTYWLHTDDGTCLAADTIVVSFVAPPTFSLGADTTICEGDSLILGYTCTGCTYLWNTNETSSSITTKQSGIHWLKAGGGTCQYTDSINIGVTPIVPINLGADTVLCVGDSIQLSHTCIGCTYLWSTNETTNTTTVKQADTYWLHTTNGNCKIADTILITFNALPVLDLGKDSMTCVGDSITLSAPSGYTTIWNDNSTSSTRSIKSTGKYWVQITDGAGCKNADTINLAFNPKPIFNLGIDSTICPNGSITLKTPFAAAQKIWSTGEITDSITTSTSGIYWARITQNSCSYTDSIEIKTSAPYTKKLKDTSICNGQTVILEALTLGATYLWDDATTQSNVVVSKQGKYKVNLQIGYCKYTDSAFVTLLQAPKKPTLRDTTVCESAINVFLDGTTSNADTYLWNNGITTPKLQVDSGGRYIVIAKNKCGFVADTATITVELCAPPFIPNVFTPNRDGLNDFFSIDFSSVTKFEIEIYNRWGERLFQSNDPAFRWDGNFKGEPVPSGAYFYVLTSTLGIGKTFNSKGSLTLFR